jgi:DNA-binding transcriptional regulator YiaG
MPVGHHLVMHMDDLRNLARAHERLRDRRTARAIRIRAGITEAQMAQALNVSQSTISRWEGGSRQPRGQAAVRWVQILNELDSVQKTPAAA